MTQLTENGDHHTSRARLPIHPGLKIVLDIKNRSTRSKPSVELVAMGRCIRMLTFASVAEYTALKVAHMKKMIFFSKSRPITFHTQYDS
jgi:hypothetical protein